MFEHWGRSIYWDAMTWEAFATLAAGLAAVIGATLVGLRQMAISKRQVALQQLELRRLLYDLRRPIYDATRRWLSFILQTGHIPNRPGAPDQVQLDRRVIGAREAELERQAKLEGEFLQAIEDSRFVFGPEVFSSLENLWVQGNEMHYHRVSQRAINADRQRHIDEEARLHRWFVDAIKDLANVFGDELKVSDGGASTYRPLRKFEAPGTDANAQ